jgi:hypothetical protein
LRLEKKLAILAAILFGVFGTNAGESLANGSCRLISGENAFADSANGARVLDEFSGVRSKRHGCFECWKKYADDSVLRFTHRAPSWNYMLLKFSKRSKI